MLLMRHQDLWQQAAATTDTFAALVTELRDLLRRQEQMLAEREQELSQRERVLDDRLEHVATREAQVAERERELRQAVEEFAQQQSEARALLQQVQADRSVARIRSIELSEREKALVAREEQVRRSEAELKARAEALTEREEALAAAQQELARWAQAMAEQERALQFGVGVLKRQGLELRSGGGEVALRPNAGTPRVLADDEAGMVINALPPFRAAAPEPWIEPVTAQVIGPGGETQIVEARVTWDPHSRRRRE